MRTTDDRAIPTALIIVTHERIRGINRSRWVLLLAEVVETRAIESWRGLTQARLVLLLVHVCSQLLDGLQAVHRVQHERRPLLVAPCTVIARMIVSSLLVLDELVDGFVAGPAGTQVPRLMRKLALRFTVVLSLGGLVSLQLQVLAEGLFSDRIVCVLRQHGCVEVRRVSVALLALEHLTERRQTR